MTARRARSAAPFGCAVPAPARTRLLKPLALLALCVVLRPGVAHAEVIDLRKDPEGTKATLRRVSIGEARGPAAAAETSLAEELDRKLAAIEREAARLARAGDAASAARFEEQHRAFRDRRAGRDVPAARALAEVPEVHAVGVYRGGAAPDGRTAPSGGVVSVEVTATDRPIVLVLCAYESVAWDLRVDPAVRLNRVLLGGYEEQAVLNLPPDVPVGRHAYANDRAGGFYAYARAGEQFETLAARVRELTGLEVSTFQGDRGAGERAFMIGPGNAEWAAQRLLRDVEPLYHEAVARAAAEARAAVRDVRFRAVEWTVDPGAGRGFIQGSAALAQFTPAGPIEGTAVPLPVAARDAAVDPRNNTAYVLGPGQVARVDGKTRRAFRIEPDTEGEDAALPELSHPCGIAFDTKRNRMVVATLGGTGHLYAYDPAVGAWSVIADLDDVDLAALTYAPDADCFYGLPAVHDESTPLTLIRFSADGKPEQLLRPSRRVTLGRTRSPFAPGVQLAPVGEGRLAVVTTSEPQRDPRNRRRLLPGPPPRCYLIDTWTGEVTYAGRMYPQPSDASPPLDGEFDALWETMGSGDGLAPEQAATRLAAGGDAAATFLAAELAPSPEEVDARRVREWVAQLDHDDFAHRNDAARELRRLGPAAIPALREVLADGASPEASVRIEAIVRSAELRAKGDTAPLRDRQSLALRTLSRIGTPPAIDALRRAANDTTDPVLASEARTLLRDFAAE